LLCPKFNLFAKRQLKKRVGITYLQTGEINKSAIVHDPYINTKLVHVTYVNKSIYIYKPYICQLIIFSKNQNFLLKDRYKKGANMTGLKIVFVNKTAIISNPYAKPKLVDVQYVAKLAYSVYIL
jgi:hypothetical protein